MADRVARMARSRALVIGVARYDDPALPDLPSGDRAAEDLARAFAEWSTNDVVSVDMVVNAGRDEFVRALVEASAEAEDQLVVYFAGHGVLSRHGELILATRDCDTRSPELTGVPWNSVRGALADTRARSVVVVLDCCFSGAADSAWQENWQTTEAAYAGTRGPQITYLMAGRAPWPYQPGVLGSALRTAMNAVPAEGGASPDFAAAARLLRREMVGISQPKLVTSGSRPTTDNQRVSPVFIIYRIEDSDVAAALDQAIANRLGEEAVFRSARSIPPGANFRTVITHAIRQARLVVAVIGPGWESRSSNPDDWVVHEIATAFEHNIPVVPVIVGVRSRIRAEHLPERIRKLAYSQSLQVRADAPEAIDAAVERLLQVL